MENINEGFRAIDPQAHLRTWRKEMKPCSRCGQNYEARISVLNGKEEQFVTECPGCVKQRREEEYRLERLAQLEEAKEAQRESWALECGLPPSFASKTFEDFKRELQPKAYDAVKNYAAGGMYNWYEDDKPPTSMVLLSPDIYGVGKTHLVSALANFVMANEPSATMAKDLLIKRYRTPVHFTSENQLLARIRATYNRKADNQQECESEEDVYTRLDRFPLLIIDDVGKVRPRDYSFLQGVYFRIIDARYVNHQPVVLTTNLNLTELETHIGGACADRLVEMAGKNFIKMAGKSYRGR